jgi:cytochrome c-type biogenesis protein CcmE
MYGPYERQDGYMSVKVVVVIVLFFSAIAGALTIALLEGGIEYRSIAQLKSPNYEGERIKVRAQVVQMQSEFRPTRFIAVDIPPEGQRVPEDAPLLHVLYEGDDVPQGLQRAVHVTLEGRYDQQQGVFVATMLQTQCPSRYEGENMQSQEEALSSLRTVQP